MVNFAKREGCTLWSLNDRVGIQNMSSLKIFLSQLLFQMWCSLVNHGFKPQPFTTQKLISVNEKGGGKDMFHPPSFFSPLSLFLSHSLAMKSLTTHTTSLTSKNHLLFTCCDRWFCIITGGVRMGEVMRVIAKK